MITLGRVVRLLKLRESIVCSNISDVQEYGEYLKHKLLRIAELISEKHGLLENHTQCLVEEKWGILIISNHDNSNKVRMDIKNLVQHYGYIAPIPRLIEIELMTNISLFGDSNNYLREKRLNVA